MNKTDRINNPVTRDMIQSVIKAVAEGGTVKYGCAQNNFSHVAFYRHIKVHPDLAKEYKAARILHGKACCDKAITCLSKAVDKVDAVGVSAAKFILERSPESLLRQGVLQIEGGTEIRIVFGASPEETAKQDE